MAEKKSTSGAKKFKLDHNDVEKAADISPPILKSVEKTKRVCDDCKVYKAANENLTVKNSELQGQNEKLREVIKNLLKETEGNPDHLDRLLTTGQSDQNLQEDRWKNVAAQKALGNSLILGQVFGFFDDSTLLKLRLVCKFWAHEASSRIRHLIRLVHNPEENTLGKPGVGGLPDLMSLMATYVETGQKFPWTHFWLTSPNLMVIPDAVVFLEKFGYLIEHLHLDLVNLMSFFMTSGDLTECLRNLLFKWSPNLKFFAFYLNSWSGDSPARLLNDTGEFVPALTLPNLQTLTWLNPEAGQKMFLDLLKSCPNLKKIINFPYFFCIKEAIEAEKTGAIKELQFDFGGAFNSGSSMFALSSEYCFQVEQINIMYNLYGLYDGSLYNFLHSEQFKTKIQLLNKVLRNNRNCLKKIVCSNMGLLAESGLEIPVMPNVKTLEIRTHFRSRLTAISNLPLENFCRVFPKGLDVATAFPKLAHISWDIKVMAGYPPDSIDVYYRLPIFDTVGPLTSVRSLTISIVEEGNLELLRKIAVFLPNVKVLKYTESFAPYLIQKDAADFKIGFLETLRIICEHFQGLEEIHLLPFLKRSPETGFLKYSPAQLVDSAITGLDLATVQKLARKSPNDLKLAGKPQHVSVDQEKDLEAPSIRNMKSLRYLKISVQGDGCYPIFTHVSGTHGFGLMKNLTVVIEATREKRSVIQDPEGFMSPNMKFYQVPRKSQSNY